MLHEPVTNILQKSHFIRSPLSSKPKCQGRKLVNKQKEWINWLQIINVYPSICNQLIELQYNALYMIIAFKVQ